MGQNFFIYSVYNPLSGILCCKNSANKLWYIEEKNITFAVHLGIICKIIKDAAK